MAMVELESEREKEKKTEIRKIKDVGLVGRGYCSENCQRSVGIRI